MAKIFVSLSGEGRGHATRVCALTDALSPMHDVVIHTFGDGFETLSRRFAGTEVEVRRIAGLRFGYDVHGSLHLGRTVSGALHYIRAFPHLLGSLRANLERELPDLVITDFEPALARVAAALGIPHISLNHQHFLLTYDLSSLPRWLRVHTVYMKWVVRAYDSPAVARIVSSFYFPPLKAGCENVTQTGVMLRRAVLQAAPETGNHLLVYWRRQAPAGGLEALSRLGREVRVYGLGDRPSHGNLRFLATQDARFVSDLSSCAALVCTAGNQLVGEAIYLRKPVLAVPEPGNYEQYINAHFLARMHAGDWTPPHQFTTARMLQFLDRTDSFQSLVPAARMHGLPAVLQVLRRHLGTPVDVPQTARPEPVIA